MSKDLLTQKQICEIISFSSELKQETLKKQDITRSYLFEMLTEGDFPQPKKFGKTRRWQKSDIEKWLKDQKN